MLSVVSTVLWAGVSDCTHKNEKVNPSLWGSGSFAEEEGRQTLRVSGDGGDHGNCLPDTTGWMYV